MSFDPHAVVEAGRKVYERYRDSLERRFMGKFVVIDVPSEKYFIGDSPEAAYREARKEKHRGPFHLVRVGARAAFRSRRSPHGGDSRFIR